ncbi:mannitol-1-phosphate 5-dehydrogenase [Fictibacillus sp. KIGAM418]|uniref:Mannitol-1-phosphate 5-dehydrogenase n=1 Tax=Fictibacillus marinisediminis TaxID=2878389 RepID=A0A9X1X7C9_9BACL|nr:mannitol-1-phosphate 5-dehydrogenase [Fictibacillus marinisediminis]MCK6255246.1 mannitol-1-phosphate 5-dehydrogenase [Fictibacillus marinisediminis]
MLAVHFGAGNIGRGFIGNLLFQSGYQTVFVDVNQEIVDLLNEKNQYTVVLADKSQEELQIRNVSAVNSGTDPDQVIELIANADLVTAAVGPNILPFIAGSIAEGLRKRIAANDAPLNIIACENMIGGSTLLKEKVYEKLEESEKQLFDSRFGFPDAAVDRIVPNQSNEDKLMVKVEPFYEWAVDETKIIGSRPEVEGITYVEDLKPYIERKLFTVNTGHAAAAYIGYQAGMRTIDEAMKIKELQELIQQTLQETGRMLISKYAFEPEEHQKYIEKIVNRFVNPYITDEVTRVGRSPIRKLGPADRLVSPAVQYLQLTGDVPVSLTRVIASAFLYDYKEDPDAVAIQEAIYEKGIERAIEQFTGIEAGSILSETVLDHYHQLKSGITIK